MALIDAVVPPPRASAVDASFQEVLDACAAAGAAGVHDLATLPGDIDYYAARADPVGLSSAVARDAASHEQIRRSVLANRDSCACAAPSSSATGYGPVACHSSGAFVYGLRHLLDGVLTQAMGSWTAPCSSKGYDFDLQRERTARRRKKLEGRGLPNLGPRHRRRREPPDPRRLSSRPGQRRRPTASASSTSRSYQNRTFRGSPS